MQYNEIKTGKIVRIDELDKYNDMHKFQCVLTDGTAPFFLTTKPTFEHKVGDEIRYTIKKHWVNKGETFISAKLYRENTYVYNKGGNAKVSIHRQVAFKGAIDGWINSKISTKEIEQFTDIFETILEKKS